MEAYSGTTLENFSECALEKKGEVYFVKNMVPQCVFSNVTFYTDSFNAAVIYALIRASELGHTPVIMTANIGEVDGNKTYDNTKEFLIEEPLAIKEVFRPKDIYNGSFPLFKTPHLMAIKTQKLKRFFEVLSPLELLAELGVIV